MPQRSVFLKSALLPRRRSVANQEATPMRFSYMLVDPIADLNELSRRMAVIRELGYHGIELTGTYPLGLAVEDVADLSRRHSLPVVSVLSGWSYAHEGLCLSVADPAIRKRAKERLVDYVRIAAKLNALVVVGLMRGFRKDEPDEAKAIERIVEALSYVAQTAEQEGVTVVNEPVNHLQVGFIHTAREASAVADRVGSPNIGYMLDTIHMNIEERSVIDTIRDHGARARHFHLCETHGGRFGTGGLDFPGVLATLRTSGYGGYTSLKIYRGDDWETGARASAEFLRGCGASFRS
jgi:sugar phosphate isomerase/epimerase